MPESDYASGCCIRSSRNIQSSFLNDKAVAMLTLKVVFFVENNWHTRCYHFFSSQKNYLSDYWTAEATIVKDVKELGFNFDLITRIMDNAAVENRCDNIFANLPYESKRVFLYKVPSHGKTQIGEYQNIVQVLKSFLDGLHGWPQQEANRLSAADEIHTVADLVEKLAESEREKQKSRKNKLFSRYYHDLDEMDRIFIKKCDATLRCNSMMVRQATFDFVAHRLLLRSVLCLCEICLKGKDLSTFN